MKTFLSLLLLGFALLCSTRTSAQIVAIPDANFKQVLIYKGIDTNNNGQIELSEAAVVTYLDISYQYISDLTGIDAFTSLDTLYCNHGFLINLPALPSTLTLLNCSQNKLTSLPALPSTLTLLNCSQNKLTSLPALPSGLTDFDCSSNQLTSLPALPSGLTYLSCSNNQLTSLPALPNSLTYLECGSNQLTILPVLPSNLTMLSCINNQLTSLPALPSTLAFLYCWSNQLTSLPSLPSTLNELHCYNNQLTSLPALPSTLAFLYCWSNQLTSLPSLPSALMYLNCDNNQLTSLPALSSALIELNCNNNQLMSLPTLPILLDKLYCNNNQLTSLPAPSDTLKELECSNNQLTSLPILPSYLGTLICSNNQLTGLPALPSMMTFLSCENNQLTSLPALPSALGLLFCYDNQLTSLPTLPSMMYGLYCNNNQLTTLPTLPNNMYSLYCDSNQITCFPIFPSTLSYLSITYNPATCIPNYVPAMDTAILAMPICVDNDPIHNPNGCLEAGNLTGYTYRDSVANCLRDTNESILTNIPMAVYDTNMVLLGKTYSLATGAYNFVQKKGKYIVKLDTANIPFTTLCPDTQIVTTTAINSLATDVNFGLTCKPGFDVGVQAIWRQGWVFPGQQHTAYALVGDMAGWFGFSCANGVSGQVKITYSGPVTYVGAASGAPVPSSVLGNTLTYNIANFGANAQMTDFASLFLTDTTAQAGNQVCITVEVTPKNGDTDTTNNVKTFCYSVINSYDPNIKEVSPAALLPNSTDWLTYTIQFQNTGSAPAFNITLRDTLDANLNLETFQVMNYSHANTTTLNGNIVKVKFPNIMLADSATNEPASHGFIQYRIRPKANLPEGAQIPNRAAIYFDFNAPIITNTATTAFTTSISSIEKQLFIKLSPNPTSGAVVLTPDVEIRNYRVRLTDLAGRILLEMAQQNGAMTLPTEHLAAGTYLVYLQSEQGYAVRKLVKE